MCRKWNKMLDVESSAQMCGVLIEGLPGDWGAGGQPRYCAQCWALCVEMGKGEQRTSGSRIPWGSVQPS